MREKSEVGRLLKCILVILFLSLIPAEGSVFKMVIAESLVHSAIQNNSKQGPRLREEALARVDTDQKQPPAKYKKISKIGEVVDETAISWSCVFDELTGLTWEVKTNDSTMHNKNIEVRWGETATSSPFLGRYLGNNWRAERSTIDRTGLSFGDLDFLIDASNTEKLCGYDDWRVPSLYESFSLVRCSTGKPDLDRGCNKKSKDGVAIDLQFFPNSTADAYWTSSRFSKNPNQAWATHFSDGSDLTYYRGSYLLVRLVRGPKR